MHKLSKITARSKKRVGRGYGSGKGGHTVGRGQKGQKSRGSVGILFEGVKVKKSLLRRLPIQRGKTKFKVIGKKVTVTTRQLNHFADGSLVTLQSLVSEKLVNRSGFGLRVKIVHRGDLKKKLQVSVPTSERAAKVIQEAGGTLVS